MNRLGEIIAANRAGEHRGIPSYCTAHVPTLRAIIAAYRGSSAPILIEATCNQVNQFGGYTGMTPVAYRDLVYGLAEKEGIDPGRIILGGDHLGPNPWKSEPASTAMNKAQAMVEAYAKAGFTKIHLDASMACADDDALDEATMAQRAAELCKIAEKSATGISYVIGTEVPIPGGETGVLETLAVTDPQSARRTYELHNEAFAARGLSAAFERVIGLVVQPGVDFGNDQVFAFRPQKALALVSSIHALSGAIFEAHSTDYQESEALRALVQNHFAILKVGPELTFAFRQAIFSMAQMEAALPVSELSNIVQTIGDEMEAEPRDWRSYIPVDERERTTMLYGLSDRVRYYWSNSRIEEALERLYANLRTYTPEKGLIAQFTGLRVDECAGMAEDLPRRLINHMVGQVVDKYCQATQN